MRVYRSNRVERLLDALAEIVAVPLSDPFATEQVVVHSRGMAVWLQMRLAERLGVWAGGAFPFPRRFVQSCFSSVLGERATAIEAFDKQRLIWTIAATLPGYLDHPAFAELNRFLTDDPRGTKAFQLAARIADAFDQYVVYRPELVLGWESGHRDDWQAVLWRAVVDALGSNHTAALARDFFARLHDPTFDPQVLPERVCVFGVTTLPPFYVQVLAAIARHRPVHLLLPSPSREYWAEIRSHRDLLREARRTGEPPDLSELAAPSLLRSLGAVGRDFQHVLEAEVDYEEGAEDLYVEPENDTLLGALQADVLTLRDRSTGELALVPIARDDDSISIHACHSPMREVEVLHDRILDLLARDPTLQPRDIVVMMSDVETYAPLVEAVFGRDPEDTTYIPHCVADRSVRAESPILEAFHRILELVGGRVTASEVLDLLALEAIGRRFELEPEDVDTLTGWVIDAGIRWGIDGTHRKRHGQPPTDQNTWRFGLDRLLLGHALPGHGKQTFASVLPYDEVEGQSTVLIGKLAELCDRLFSTLTTLQRPRAVAQWQEAFGELLDGLLASDHAAWEAQPLRQAIEAVVADAAASGYDEPVELEAMRTLIDDRIEEDRPVRGFLAGGVTLCAMLPMRTIPFRVVCLLGMGDTQFPRAARHVGFDLIAQHPRAGDRSRRADDRYLFLEALLSARDKVLISYVGQSIQDNSDIPPSVVVADLLDHLADNSAPLESAGVDTTSSERAASLRERLVVRHPMQPFSPRYFSGEDARLFSYEPTWRQGAQALAEERSNREGTPLLEAPLAPVVTTSATRELALSKLVRFFRMPATELLKRRLGVNLDDYSRDRSDREPMELDNLEEWKLASTVVTHHLDELPKDASLGLLRASGDLPHGTPGTCRYEEIARAVHPIVTAAKRLMEGGPRPNVEVDHVVGDTRIVGVVGRRYASGRVICQYAQLRAKHMLAAWIEHLTQCLVGPDDAPLHTTVIARGDKRSSAVELVLRPVAQPAEHLEALVQLYWRGQCEPVLLFPRSSLAFCKALAERKPLDEALEEARKQWADRFMPEGGDPHLRRLFGDADVLDPSYELLGRPAGEDAFPHVSVRVFEPLLRHAEER